MRDMLSLIRGLNFADLPRLVKLHCLKFGLSLLCLAVIGFTVSRYFFLLLDRPHLYPAGDQLIWIERVLIPFRDGSINFFQAVTFEYEVLSHSHIPSLGWLLLNERFFGLDLRIDMWIGFACALATIFLVFKYLFSLAKLNLTSLLSLTAISTIILSTANGASFSWSVLIFQFVGLSMAVFYMYKFQTLFFGPFWKLALFTIFILLFSGSIGTAAVISSLIFGFILALKNKSRLLPWGLHLLTVGFCIICFGWMFNGGRVHSPTGFGDFFQFIINNPNEFWRGGLNSLSQVFVHERRHEPTKYFPFMPSFMVGRIITILTLGFAIFAIQDALRKRNLPLESWLFPSLMIFTGLLIVAGALKSRLVVGGANYILAPRYFTTFSVLGIGVILFLTSWVLNNKTKLSGVFASLFFVLVIAFNWMSSSYTFGIIGYTDRYIQLRTEAMTTWRDTGLENVQTLVGGPCKDKVRCQTVLEYLEKHELSAFKTAPFSEQDIAVVK